MQWLDSDSRKQRSLWRCVHPGSRDCEQGSPKSVKAGLSKEEAEAIKAKLEELGGKVSIELD